MRKIDRLILGPVASVIVLSCGGGSTEPVPVLASLTVSFPIGTIQVGQSSGATVTGVDQFSAPIATGPVTWSTGSTSVATVSGAGIVTGVAAGQTTVVASAGGKQAQAGVTVTPAPGSNQINCTGVTALQLTVGDVHTLTSSERSTLCLAGGASGSEYVLIPFNNTKVAASTFQVEITASNTATIQAGALATVLAAPSVPTLIKPSINVSLESDFRARERRDVAGAFSAPVARTRSTGALAPRFITGVPTDPTVGSSYPININLSGNSCTSAKTLHDAVVVAKFEHTLVLSDTQSPTGGYTDAEMAAFGQAFDTLGYAVDTLAFGAETDIDQNGRVAIVFTPSLNALPAPPGATLGGLFATRDLAPIQTCLSSNEGEMFYVPVPDPGKTINGNYAVKADLAKVVLGSLVHEFQHLINAGRHAYVNNANTFEEVWLNEGLSHIAEELLYYRISGNSPRSNITLSVLQSSQAQLDAANAYLLGNMARLLTYMASPEINSPFALNDDLETRGAIWQLLRYAADRKGGNENGTWRALTNSTVAGQANFNAVFGDIMTSSRDWAVAQFADDGGFTSSASFAHPSWNYRSVLPPINSGKFPLFTRPLLSAPVDIALSGGGAAYVRFRVNNGITAGIATSSSGQAVPAAVEFILMRTQ